MSVASPSTISSSAASVDPPSPNREETGAVLVHPAAVLSASPPSPTFEQLRDSNLPLDSLIEVSENGALHVLDLLSSIPSNVRDVFLSLPKDVMEDSERARGYLSEKVISRLADVPKSQWAQESKRCLEVMALLFPAESMNGKVTEASTTMIRKKFEKEQEGERCATETEIDSHPNPHASVTAVTTTCSTSSSRSGNCSPRSTSSGGSSTSTAAGAMQHQCRTPLVLLPPPYTSPSLMPKGTNSNSNAAELLQAKPFGDQERKVCEKGGGKPAAPSGSENCSTHLSHVGWANKYRKEEELLMARRGVSTDTSQCSLSLAFVAKVAEVCNAEGQILTANLNSDQNSTLRRLLLEKLQQTERYLEQLLGKSDFIIDLTDLLVPLYEGEKEGKSSLVENREDPKASEYLQRKESEEQLLCIRLEEALGKDENKATTNSSGPIVNPPPGFADFGDSEASSNVKVPRTINGMTTDSLLSHPDVEGPNVRKKSNSVDVDATDVDAGAKQFADFRRHKGRAKTTPTLSMQTEQIQGHVVALIDSLSSDGVEVGGESPMRYDSSGSAESDYLGLKKKAVRFSEAQEPGAEEGTTRKFFRGMQRSNTLPGIVSNIAIQSNDVQQFLHMQARCKPCAFFYMKKGCRNGEACEFCHHNDHSNLTLKQWKKQQQKLFRAVGSLRSYDSMSSISDGDCFTATAGSAAGSPAHYMYDRNNGDMLGINGSLYNNADESPRTPSPTEASIDFAVDPAIDPFSQLGFSLGLPHPSMGGRMVSPQAPNAIACPTPYPHSATPPYPFNATFSTASSGEERFSSTYPTVIGMPVTRKGNENSSESLNLLEGFQSQLSLDVSQQSQGQVAVSIGAGRSPQNHIAVLSRVMGSAVPPEQNSLDVVYGAIGKELQAHLAALLQD